MIDNPECAVCGATQWLTLAEHKYNRSRLVDNNPSGYQRARYRVLFDLWFTGKTDVTLTSLGCEHCGFVCFSPRPTIEDIDRKYHFLATDQDSQNEYGKDLPSDAIRARELYRFIRKHHGEISGQLIDFGGGKGRLLGEFIKRGTTCSIIDYQNEVTSGANYLGCDPSRLEPHQAEVVICSHVIEHLADPLSDLKSLSRLLDQNGVIYIEVPLEVWKKCPPKMDPVTHINFFTKQSMSSLIQQAGLQIVLCKYETFTRPNGKVGMAVKALAKPKHTTSEEETVFSGIDHTRKLLSPSLLKSAARMLRHPRLFKNLLDG